MTSFAFAEPYGFMVLSQNKDKADLYFENGKLKQQVLGQINAQAAKAPKELTALFGNNKINVKITLDNGSTASYFVRTNGGKVAEVLQGTRNDADLEVKVKESTIDRVSKSKLKPNTKKQSYT